MQTQNKKFNQLIFTEYEKRTKTGHKITVNDSYKNVIARIHEQYNQDTGKYEYTAFDHAGVQIGVTTEKLWELKKQFTDNREKFLEEAHQRRIAEKNKSKDTQQPTHAARTEVQSTLPRSNRQNRDVHVKEVINEMAQNGKSEQQPVSKTQPSVPTRSREEELEQLRDMEDGHGNERHEFEL